jgi:hypothetical protein
VRVSRIYPVLADKFARKRSVQHLTAKARDSKAARDNETSA